MSDATFSIPAGVPPHMAEAAHGEVMDLVIAGMGMAGLAAGVFALNRGLKTAGIGGSGGLAYATGYLDVLDAPRGGGPDAPDPRQGFAAFRKDHPEHPYAGVSWREMETAMAEFTDFLAEAGLPYAMTGSALPVLTPLGAAKTTYAVPATMAGGVAALRDRTPCLLVDFAGLKAFSARGIAAALREVWPGITPLTLSCPELQWTGELYPEAMALDLEVPAAREALASAIRPHLGGALCVGLPAILGMNRGLLAHAHMTELLGVPVFEIPTIPPSVPGIRLRERLEDALRGKGMAFFSRCRAFAVRKENGIFHMGIGETGPGTDLMARSLVLATGRFLGGGLAADRERGIGETLLGLPVAAPESREDWHREDLFDPAGHPVNKAGIRVDEAFRPLGDGGVVDPALYAIGSILAGQDWVREKSGAGIAVSSAWKAVNDAARRKEEAL